MDMVQRKIWNENHQVLTDIIAKPDEHDRAVTLFLNQHAWLYASKMSGASSVLTFEDSLLDNLDDRTMRMFPVQAPGTKNSIVWHLWHLARVEDMTMNILVSDGPQVFDSGNWLHKLNIRFPHSGNSMEDSDIAELSSKIDWDALSEYRIAVGRQTRRILSSLQPGGFREKVQARRIQRLFEEQAVLREAGGIADYWSKKSVAGLVLMPATRHHILHLNKCARIKHSLRSRNRRV